MKISHRQAVLAMWIATAIFGSAFVAIRYAGAFYSAGTLLLLRFLTAALVLSVVYYFYPNKVKPTLPDLGKILIISLCGFTGYGLALNQGEHTVSGAMSGFIVGQTPILVTLLAMGFYHERVRRLGKMGFGISFIGLLFILLGAAQQDHLNLNFFLVVLALVLNSLYIFLQKPLFKKFHAIELTTFYVWLGIIPLLLFTPELFHTLILVSWKATAAVVYLGAACSAFGYLAWNYGSSHMASAHATSFLYLVPLFALLFEALLLHHVPTPLALSGGLLALLGAYLISRK